MILTKEQINKYQIISRNSCEKYCMRKHPLTSMIISIRSSWDKVPPQIFCSDDNNVKYVLFLAFDDLDKEDSESLCMQLKDGVMIAEFVNAHYDEVDKIIVHCDGGISRSSGVCAAIMRVKEGDDYPVFRKSNKHPNMTCYLQTLKGFLYI